MRTLSKTHFSLALHQNLKEKDTEEIAIKWLKIFKIYFIIYFVLKKDKKYVFIITWLLCILKIGIEDFLCTNDALQLFL